jgi:hypothetical protein
MGESSPHLNGAEDWWGRFLPLPKYFRSTTEEAFLSLQPPWRTELSKGDSRAENKIGMA